MVYGAIGGSGHLVQWRVAVVHKPGNEHAVVLNLPLVVATARDHRQVPRRVQQRHVQVKQNNVIKYIVSGRKVSEKGDHRISSAIYVYLGVHCVVSW